MKWKDDQDFNLRCLKLNCYLYFIPDLKSSLNSAFGSCQKFFSMEIVVFDGELVTENSILRGKGRVPKQGLKE